MVQPVLGAPANIPAFECFQCCALCSCLLVIGKQLLDANFTVALPANHLDFHPHGPTCVKQIS